MEDAVYAFVVRKLCGGFPIQIYIVTLSFVASKNMWKPSANMGMTIRIFICVEKLAASHKTSDQGHVDLNSNILFESGSI